VDELRPVPADRPPEGFTVALDRRVRHLTSADGGVSLLGLSPGRLLHLTPAASGLLGGHDSLTVRDATSSALARRLLDAGIAHPVASTEAPTERDVTVVIPVRDRPSELRRLLGALADTAPECKRVIVVDDGSAEPAACREIARGTGAAVIRRDHSGGPSVARNSGLAAADTDLVVFLDSDVVPEPGWLPPLLTQLADPVVALAAPRIVGLKRTGGGGLERYEQLRSSLDLGRDPGPVLPRTRIAYVPSAALLVRRDLVRARLFDEQLHVAEDVDLVLRLHEAGWRVRYEPKSRVAHEHRVEPVSWARRKAFYGTGAAPLALRHPGSVPPLVLAPWAAAVCLLAASTRRLGAVAAVGVTGYAWLRLRRSFGRLRHPGRAASLLVALGLGSAVRQSAEVLTRHWWPLTLLACVVSRRARRATLLAALAEGGYDWLRHRDGETDLDVLRYVVAHRVDDLAYGSGLWWGALRVRTLAPLRPLVIRNRRKR
jgi:mycofactocin system glycosyltransferase